MVFIRKINWNGAKNVLRWTWPTFLMVEEKTHDASNTPDAIHHICWTPLLAWIKYPYNIVFFTIWCVRIIMSHWYIVMIIVIIFNCLIQCFNVYFQCFFHLFQLLLSFRHKKMNIPIIKDAKLSKQVLEYLCDIYSLKTRITILF